jgi:hypothetical protein
LRRRLALRATGLVLDRGRTALHRRPISELTGNKWKINFHAGAFATRILGVEDDDNDDT